MALLGGVVGAARIFLVAKGDARKSGKCFGYKVVVGTSNALFYRPQHVGQIRRWVLTPSLALRGTRIKPYFGFCGQSGRFDARQSQSWGDNSKELSLDA